MAPGSPTASLANARIQAHTNPHEGPMDPTYNLNGGFKPTLKRFADLDGPDFFPALAWATYALLESERFEREIWECSCGNGAMSRILLTTGLPVLSSDLYD